MPSPLDYFKNLGVQKPPKPIGTPIPLPTEDPNPTVAKSMFEGGTDALLGLLGVGPETKANLSGQLVSAGVPLAGAVKGMPGFYSRLTRSAEALPDIPQHPNKMLTNINRYAEGVNPEEIQYRKLNEFLKSKGNDPVTRGEVLAHLEQNPPPTVNMKRLGDSITKLDMPDAETWFYRRYGFRPDDDQLQRILPRYHAELNVANNPTKYHNYQLPGGQNYREDLMMLHPQTPEAKLSQAFNGTKHADPSLTFQSSHFDEPNILAHVRHQERRLPVDPQDYADHIVEEGSKGRMLENIQSDWHQKGAKEGYIGSTLPEGYTIRPGQPTGGRENSWSQTFSHPYLEVIDPAGNWVQAGLTEEDAIRNALEVINKGAVPDAPFKDKGWVDLALKQQILDIANRPDLDWMGITPGEELIKRGEGHSTQFMNQEVPSRLAKLLKPFGGQVEDAKIKIYRKAPEGVTTTLSPQDQQLWDVAQKRKEGSPFNLTHLSPAMKAAILKKGFPIMSLMGLMQSQQEPEK